MSQANQEIEQTQAELKENIIENPLHKAMQTLNKGRKLGLSAMFLPAPLIALAVAGFFYFEPNWYKDLFLTLIFALFVVGQLFAIFHFLSQLSRTDNSMKAIRILQNAGPKPDLQVLQQKLLKKAPDSPLRELSLNWIRSGLQGEVGMSQLITNNAQNRRTIREDSHIGLHIGINRTTLKLGFLGTLIGLVMTFPPMKRAILGLTDSDGEMRFVQDIAKAIEGDEFAILTTLIATALSLLVEMVTIQILDRLLSNQEVAASYLEDWNLSCLQPWIRRQYGPEASHQKIIESQNELNNRILQLQRMMDQNIKRTFEAVQKTGIHLDELTESQNRVDGRVQRLVEFENNYRNFIETKDSASIPDQLRPGAGA